MSSSVSESRGSLLSGRTGAFVGGALAGLLSGLLLSRPGILREAGRAIRAAGATLGGGGRAAAGTLGGAVERVREAVGAGPVGTDADAPGRTGPDRDAVAAAVQASPLASRVQARLLGRGVVELTGSATDAAAVLELQRGLRELPGVDFVVDRVWVPGEVPGARDEPDAADVP